MNVTSTAFAEATGGSNISPFGNKIKDGPNPLEYLTTYWVGASTWNIVTAMLMFIYFVAGCVAFFYYIWYIHYVDDDKNNGGGYYEDDNKKRSSSSRSSFISPLLKHSAEQMLNILEKLE